MPSFTNEEFDESITKSEARESIFEKGDFANDLCALINKYCIDNDLATPDFIVAQEVLGHLEGLRLMTIARARWFVEAVKNMPEPLEDGEG